MVEYWMSKDYFYSTKIEKQLDCLTISTLRVLAIGNLSLSHHRSQMEYLKRGSSKLTGYWLKDSDQEQLFSSCRSVFTRC